MLAVPNSTVASASTAASLPLSDTATPTVSGRRRRLRLALGLDERRLAALGKGHGDRVEVAWHDRVGERQASLVAQLAREVARRQVRERKQAHAGRARDLGG